MLTTLRRRGWVLLVTVLVATACAYLVASTRGATYTAESKAVVAGHSKQARLVVTPDQANALAPTYATLLPNDAALLQYIATTLGTTVPAVQDRLSVLNPAGTALLVIDYEGTSADNAIAGATTALDAIAGARPVTPNIIPSSVGVVQAPATASASIGVPVLVTIGVIVGIALGLLLLVVWERVDPRIERPEDLSEEIGSPTSPAGEISESGANALIARWKALAEPGPSRIALVPVTPDVEADLPRVALRLSQAGGNGNAAEPPSNGHRARTADSEDLTQSVGNGTPVVITCEVPSADLTALQSIMNCDLVVLVARKGTPRAALRELLESLTEFGVSPKWAIFLGSRSAELAAAPEAR
jgi:capsular polysaccharide biosynthesis protein